MGDLRAVLKACSDALPCLAGWQHSGTCAGHIVGSIYWCSNCALRAEAKVALEMHPDAAEERVAILSYMRGEARRNQYLDGALMVARIADDIEGLKHMKATEAVPAEGQPCDPGCDGYRAPCSRCKGSGVEMLNEVGPDEGMFVECSGCSGMGAWPCRGSRHEKKEGEL